MRERAEARIGHLYPTVNLPDEYGGEEAAVIAWIWARTVRCSNPACGFDHAAAQLFRFIETQESSGLVGPPSPTGTLGRSDSG